MISLTILVYVGYHNNGYVTVIQLYKLQQEGENQ